MAALAQKREDSLTAGDQGKVITVVTKAKVLPEREEIDVSED